MSESTKKPKLDPASRPVRYSKAADMLLEQMNENTAIDLVEMEHWFFTHSPQTVIGDGTISDYLMHLKLTGKLKPKV